MTTLSKIDEKYIFIESKEVDKFSTWDRGWVESAAPSIVAGKFYKFISKDNWEELDTYPKDMSKPSECHVWDEVVLDWVEDAALKESKREADIIAKADEIIYSKYPQIEQNKCSSKGIKINFHLNQGLQLTPEEEADLVYILAVDEWITGIRNKQKAAIVDGTELAAIKWSQI